MNVVEVVPVALVMATGPQVMSAVFSASSGRWQGNSAASQRIRERCRWRRPCPGC